jgi:hypothetical protein
MNFTSLNLSREMLGLRLSVQAERDEEHNRHDNT